MDKGHRNILIFREAEDGTAVRDPIRELSDWFAAHAGAVIAPVKSSGTLTDSDRLRECTCLRAASRASATHGHLRRDSYGTPNLNAPKAQRLACVRNPPKAPPILLRGGTFGGITHLKRRKTLNPFVV